MNVVPALQLCHETFCLLFLFTGQNETSREGNAENVKHLTKFLDVFLHFDFKIQEVCWFDCGGEKEDLQKHHVTSPHYTAAKHSQC